MADIITNFPALRVLQEQKKITAAQEAALAVESALLGILLSRQDAVNEIRNIVRPEAFLTLHNRTVYDLIRDFHARALPLDFVTIAPMLWENELFTKDGANPADYLAGLTGSYVAHGMAKSYANSVMDLFKKRTIDAIKVCSENPFEVAQAMADFWREHGVSSNHSLQTLGGIMDRVNDRIGDLHRAGGGFSGLPTGLKTLDDVLCGLEDGGLYVIAGRPAMGKSTLGLSIACNVAAAHDVLFFSLEMSVEQLGQRLNARYANIDLWKQKTGREIDFPALQEARNFIDNLKLQIIENGGVTAEWICAKASEIATHRKPRLIVIDHLGIVAPRDARTNRAVQVGEMTADFKSLAKAMHCPVLLLHQLNRGTETGETNRPSLANLRDSGSVEQDADAVVMIYREEYYLAKKAEKEKDQMKIMRMGDAIKGVADLLILKNRQGECKNIRVRFDGKRQVFEDLA